MMTKQTGKSSGSRDKAKGKGAKGRGGAAAGTGTAAKGKKKGRRGPKVTGDGSMLEDRAAQALPRRAREPLAEPRAPRSAIGPGDPARGKASELALRAVSAALDKKALEPALFDVRDLASYTDYILVVSGRSDRQVHAIVDSIRDELEKLGRRTLSVEDSAEGQWSLLDFGELIVHVFHHPVREFYDLESLWIDASRVLLELPPEARLDVENAY